MATKKGEGVRGVLGDLVSRDKERKEQAGQPVQSGESLPLKEHQAEPHQQHAQDMGQGGGTAETPPATERPFRKATGIKGRPRVRKDDNAVPRGEKTKITLSIDEALRDQFYRLAHAEMTQPGEFVERALRYYIQHQAKGG